MPRPNEKPKWRPPSRHRGQRVREVTRRHYPQPGKWQPPKPTHPQTDQPAAHDETAQLRAEVARLQRKLAIIERALAETPRSTSQFFAAGYTRNGRTTLIRLDDPHARPRTGTLEAATGETFPAERRGYPLSDESRAFEVTDIPYPGKLFTRTWATGDYRDGRMCIVGLDDSPINTDDELIERVEAFKTNPHATPPSAEDAQRYATIMAERQTSVFRDYMRWH